MDHEAACEPGLFSIQRRPSACTAAAQHVSASHTQAPAKRAVSSVLRRPRQSEPPQRRQILLAAATPQALAQTRSWKEELELVDVHTFVRNRGGGLQPEEQPVPTSKPQKISLPSESITHSGAIQSKLLCPRTAQDALDAWWGQGIRELSSTKSESLCVFFCPFTVTDEGRVRDVWRPRLHASIHF